MTVVTVELVGWVCVGVGGVLSLVGLPGPLVAIVGLVVWGYYGVPAAFHPYELIVMGLLFALAEGFEQLGGFIGLSLSGIHRVGWWGMMLGSLVGTVVAAVTFNPLAIPVGMVLGAIAGEYYEQESLRSALGSALGFLLGKAGGYLAKNTIVFLVILYAVFTRLV